MSTTPVKDVLLVGFGAVGAIYAYVLKRSGLARVTVVARSNYDIVNREGVHIQSSKYGSITGWKPDRLCHSVSEAADRPYSYVVITTKAIPELNATPKILAPFLSTPYTEKYPQPTYVLIQNGLNVEVDLFNAVQALGQDAPSILTGAVWILTNLRSPNVVDHIDLDRIALGVHRHEDRTTTTNTPQEQTLLNDFGGMLRAGGTTVDLVPEIQRQKFYKNLWNLTFASVATLTRHTVPAIFRPPPPAATAPYEPFLSPTTADLVTKYTVPAMEGILKEALSVAWALGFPDSSDGIPSSSVETVVEGTRKLHMDPNNRHVPSMLLDAQKGRPIEVEVIVGEVVRMARRVNVDVPRIEMLYALLLVVQNQIIRETENKTFSDNFRQHLLTYTTPNFTQLVYNPYPIVLFGRICLTEVLTEVVVAAGEAEEALIVADSLAEIEAAREVREGAPLVGGGGPLGEDEENQQDGSDDALVRSLQSMRIAQDDLPLRPGFGTAGAPTKVRTNFFPLKLPKTPLHEYDVSITPALNNTAKRLKRRLFQLAEESPSWGQNGLRGSVAHDHSSKLIAARKLPQPLTITVGYYDEDATPSPEDTTYTFTINYIQSLDTGNIAEYLSGNPQYRDFDIGPVVSAMNLVLAAHPNRAGGGVMVGRNRFFFKDGLVPVDLGGGLEAWKGFYSSVRPSHNQLMVNVNVCTTAFYKPGNLAEAMLAFQNASFGASARQFVKGLRVKTSHLHYRKTVRTLSNNTARNYKFFVEEYKQEITVEEYFKRKYRTNLKWPNLPLIDVGGSKGRVNLLPAEMCEILPNQAFRGKLSDEHTAAMITAAAKPPNVNAAAIVNQGLDSLGFRPGASPQLNAFGVSVGNDMSVVPARILGAPQVLYSQGTQAVDDRASWNLRQVKFKVGAPLGKWAVILIKDGGRDEFSGPNDPELQQICDGFARMCQTSGMPVENGYRPPIREANIPPRDPSDPTRFRCRGAINQAIKSLPGLPSIILVVLSNGDKHIYGGIKHVCDCYIDIPTVCVHAAKIRKPNGQLQYFANVSLKFNTKLGGVNHVLDNASIKVLKEQPTMVVGIDVTHPGPGSVKGTPSIAAVVASVDSNYAQYPCSLQMQKSKQEMVENLETMMVERLELFRVRNRIVPKQIIIYRDGVSEGQFSTVVEDELPKIRKAFMQFNTPSGPYTPKVSIIICGKRHHTRFFPTEEGDADSKGNPKPGTVVDRGITAVYHYDFFLQAHGGLIGTTKPTHYFVVHDEIKFPPNGIQQLTNAICYMFARATKAVSLASPAYYADLACERGRCYLHRLFQGHSGSGTSVASGASTANDEMVVREANELWNSGVNGARLKDTMFYL